MTGSGTMGLGRWEAALSDTWDDKADLLSAWRSMDHNEDYWRFLVRDVWRLDRAPVRIADFGCGYGWAGLFLLPMLASGSEYTGLDRSLALLDRGKELFATSGQRANFVQGDATQTSFDDDQFDVAIAHALTMHLPAAERALEEMIRVTRDGGLVITCDASRNAINALIHVHETEEQEHMPLSLFQRMNAHTRRRTGIDYNIGMKMPVLMHKAGLQDVGARVSDAVRLSFPPLDTPEKERVFTAICDGGLGVVPSDEASFQRAVAQLMERGLAEDEAAGELRREMLNDYRRKGRDYHIVQPGLMTISFGTVRKSRG
jgi:SAM-dependent methyltransferase